jgi:Uncharacterized conserved protein (DUF2075)
MKNQLTDCKSPPSRAWYTSSIAEFLDAQKELVLGRLTSNNEFSLLPAQRDAWRVQIETLSLALVGLSGSLFFEFSIPRMGRRIDAVIIIKSIIFVIEFKVGEAAFEGAALDQVWDYALDLKNFHEGSHCASIVPVLVATEAKWVEYFEALVFDDDKVCRPIGVGRAGLRAVLEKSLLHNVEAVLDGPRWARSSYSPTPTIVEAARSLYSQHSVEAIARYDAGKDNLRVTSVRIDEIVDEAFRERRKSICFITGVPGAGKTLVGLNVATRHRRELDRPTHAVFLSGNGPLVEVLREALTRDEVARCKRRGEKVRKGRVGESVKAFIQNVHHFRDDALVETGPPIEHVVIFDEAQRAWNLRQTVNFMQRKKNRPDFCQSEPEFLISFLDRHRDWAVVVCLVGGGQEINTGEAGIEAWLEAVNSKFPDWHLYISQELKDSEYSAGRALSLIKHRSRVHFDPCLHLAVTMRSFRAEHVSAFVKALLDCDLANARNALKAIQNKYPIAITRDLAVAKRWVRSRARGSERFGMVASSKAQRLKPHAIDVRFEIDPVQWFLNDKFDTRSSYYLEDAATEFQVQGLELDWICVSWDGDLRFSGQDWSFHHFRGDRWTNVNSPDGQKYLKNAYRVLLTRARQGMVLFVPQGAESDPTRSPGYYDSTFNYLSGLGIHVLE